MTWQPSKGAFFLTPVLVFAFWFVASYFVFRYGGFLFPGKTSIVETSALSAGICALSSAGIAGIASKSSNKAGIIAWWITSILIFVVIVMIDDAFTAIRGGNGPGRL